MKIHHMYAFTSGREDKAVLIFRFDKPDAAIDLLRTAGVNVIGSAEVYGGIER